MILRHNESGGGREETETPAILGPETETLGGEEKSQDRGAPFLYNPPPKDNGLHRRLAGNWTCEQRLIQRVGYVRYVHCRVDFGADFYSHLLVRLGCVLYTTLLPYRGE